MKKITWNKKNILIAIASFLSLGLIIFVIVFKSIYVFKPSFYVYSSYADAKTVQQINKKYTYKEYGDVSKFEYAFENNKAVAGITSDYSIISLIIEGKVAPISKELIEINKLPNPWEDYFSEATKSQMKFYNQFLDESVQENLNKLYPNYGGNYNFKFSDFVVPYFINDKVIAFDTSKILNEKNTGMDPLDFGDEIPTLEQALQKLNQSTNNLKIQWAKNERENVVMGSTLNNPLEEWDTEITKENYSTWLNNFEQIVLDGTGASMSDVKKNLFDTDSDIILNNLINPTSKITAASIYNGDALDAYFGADNFAEVEDGDRLRIIRTKYTVRILDAFVVSSSINENKRYELLEFFNDNMFNGMFWSEEEIEEKSKNVENIYDTKGILRIFDYVNYTPAANGAYKFIYNNYFKDEEGNDDDIAKNIFEVASSDESKGIYVKGVAPVSKEVLSKLTSAFQKKLNGF